MHVPLSLVSVQIFANVLRFTTQTMIGRGKSKGSSCSKSGDAQFNSLPEPLCCSLLRVSG